MMPEHDTTNALQSAIARLRAALRRALLVEAIAHVAFVVAACAGIAMLLDYFLRLPAGGRVVLAIAVIAVAIERIVRCVVAPATAELAGEHIARIVGAKDPKAATAILSALELRDGDESCSATLVEEVRKKGLAAAETAQIVDQRIRTSMTKHLVMLGAVVLVGIGLSAISVNGVPTLAIGLKRLIKPWDVEIRWPQRTLLAIAMEYEGRNYEPGAAVKVARGDTVRLTVTQRGSLARSARLRYEMDGLGSQNRLMTREASDRFTLAVPNVIGDSVFHAVAGDGESERITILAVDRPRVKKIQVSVRPPSYTGMDYEQTQESGQIRALRGSQAKIVVDANKDVKTCIAVLQKGGPGVSEIKQVSPRRFVVNMMIREDDLYVIKLTDMDGFESTRPEEFQIQAVPDIPPAVKIVQPAAGGSVLPEGAILFKFEARDDFGIRDVMLNVVVNDTPRHVLKLKGLEASPKYFVQDSWAFDLSRTRPALNPGDHVLFRAQANDGREDLSKEIRSLVTELLPQVSDEMKQARTQFDAAVDAEYKKIIAKPGNLDETVPPSQRQKVKELLDKVGAEKQAARKEQLTAELKSLIGSFAEKAVEATTRIAKLIDDECDRLTLPNQSKPATLANKELDEKLPGLRDKLARLREQSGLKLVYGTGIGSSEVLRMDIINREKLAELITEQQAALSGMVEDAANLQGKNAERTRTIAGGLAEKADDAGFKALVFDCQLTEDAVETKLVGARDKYKDLVTTLVQNQLDTSAARKRITLISEKFSQTLDKRIPQVRSTLQGAKDSDKAGRSAKLKESVEAQAAAVTDMMDIVARLRGWSDMEKLIVRARKIVDQQKSALDSTASLAGKYTGQTADGLDAEGKELLASAASAQGGVKTETEMLEDDLGKVAEKSKTAEATMYNRVKAILGESRKEQLIEKMDQSRDLIGKNQCVAAKGLQEQILVVLKKMVARLEAAVDPDKYDIAERGDNELLATEDATFSKLEQALKPMLAEQREVLRLTKELDSDKERASRLHMVRLAEASSRQTKLSGKALDARKELMDAVQEKKPDQKLHSVVVLPLVLQELSDSMKTVTSRLQKDDTKAETQEIEEECIKTIQDMLAALNPESIVTEESKVADQVISGVMGAIGLGSVQDAKMMQLMQIGVNALTGKINRDRGGQAAFDKLPEMLRSKIIQVADRQLLIAELSKSIGPLTKMQGMTKVEIPLPSELMKQTGDSIKGGKTGDDIQEQQKKIVAMLNEIIRTIISGALAHSTLPDEMRDAKGGDAPEGGDMTKPSPDLTHLLPGMKGNKSLEEMLLEMQRLEAWAKFTPRDMEAIRMGTKGQYGGKYGELVKYYYITLAGAGQKEQKTSPPPKK